MSVAEIPYKFLVNAAAPQRGSVTQSVTEQLRSAIVGLDLKPGELLDKGLICERLGVSRFPVSEALARLQTEGLVEIMPQRGSMVSRVRIGDVVEFMLIRKALESEAIRVLMALKPAGIVAELAPVAAHVFATAPTSDRASEADRIADLAEALDLQVTVHSDVADAAEAARGWAAASDRRAVVVAGSVILAGEALALATAEDWKAGWSE